MAYVASGEGILVEENMTMESSLERFRSVVGVSGKDEVTVVERWSHIKQVL